MNEQTAFIMNGGKFLSVSFSLSATYHQPCELSIDGQCGENEMCTSVSDSGLARNGVCKCQPPTLFVFYNPLTRKCEKMSVTSLPVTAGKAINT